MIKLKNRRNLGEILSSFTLPNRKITFLLLMLLVLCLVPKIVSSICHWTDTFAYNHTSLAYVTLQDGSLPTKPYLNTGDTVHRLTNSWTLRFIPHAMISCISMMTGLTPEQIQFLPWGGIFLIIAAYALAYTLFRSTLYAGAFALFFSVEPVVNNLTYNTYQQGWSYLYYFLILAIFYRMMSQNSEKSLLKFQIKTVFLCIFLYIGVFFTYYSANLYTIIFLLIFTPAILFSRAKNRKTKIRILVLAIMIFIPLLMMEPTVWYVLSLYGTDKLTNLPSFIYEYLLSVFGMGEPPTGGEMALGLPPSPLFLYLGIFLYGLLMFPVLYHFLWEGGKFIRARQYIFTPKGAFFLAIFCTGVVDITLYFLLGIVSYKYILLLFPLLTLIALYSWVQRGSVKDRNRKITRGGALISPKRETRKVLAVILIVLIICVTGIKYVIYLNRTTDKTFSSSEQCANWLETYTSVDNGSYLSNLLTGEKLLVQLTRGGYRTMNLFVLRPEKSAFLREYDIKSKEIFNRSHILYFIISPLDIEGEINAFPILQPPITDYQFLNKVYGDGNLIILYYSG